MFLMQMEVPKAYLQHVFFERLVCLWFLQKSDKCFVWFVCVVHPVQQRHNNSFVIFAHEKLCFFFKVALQNRILTAPTWISSIFRGVVFNITGCQALRGCSWSGWSWNYIRLLLFGLNIYWTNGQHHRLTGPSFGIW